MVKNEVLNNIKDYGGWLRNLKDRYLSSQIKAHVAVNSTLLEFYYSLGRDISKMQYANIYGSAFFETLSRDLNAELPGVKGLSARNIRYSLLFYELYSPYFELRRQSEERLEEENRQQPVAKSEEQNLQQLVAKSEEENFQQLVGKSEDENLQQVVEESAPQNRQQLVDDFKTPICPQVVEESVEVIPIRPQNVERLTEQHLFIVPWGHHVQIINKFKDDPVQALFYVKETIKNNWSRAMLMNNISADLYNHRGRAINNFDKTLPAPQSALAQEIIKDPYIFDFLTLRETYDEKELKDALLDNITRFLIELGNGFAYMGREYRIVVGGDEFFLDLLFYNAKIHAYMVLEVKTGKFQPADLGQLGFYVSSVNHSLKSEHDNPTIGLLICKDKNNLTARYSLESSTHPIGISEYELSKLYPVDFHSSMPTIEELERKLSDRLFKK